MADTQIEKRINLVSQDSSKGLSEDLAEGPAEGASQGLRLETNLNINNNTKGTAGSKNLSCLFGNNK